MTESEKLQAERQKAAQLLEHRGRIAEKVQAQLALERKRKPKEKQEGSK